MEKTSSIGWFWIVMAFGMIVLIIFFCAYRLVDWLSMTDEHRRLRDRHLAHRKIEEMATQWKRSQHEEKKD